MSISPEMLNRPFFISSVTFVADTVITLVLSSSPGQTCPLVALLCGRHVMTIFPTVIKATTTGLFVFQAVEVNNINPFSV